MAFHIRNCVGTRDDRSFAVQWLACTFPCRRFAGALADVCARLRADVGRYSFTVRDLHPLLLAGLPAHSENLHKSRHSRPLVLNKPGPESASAIRHCILSGQIACERTTKKHGHCAKLGTLLKPSPLWSTSRATTWPRGRPETLSIFRNSIGLPCPAGPARNGARPPESCRIVCLPRPAPPAPDLRCS